MKLPALAAVTRLHAALALALSILLTGSGPALSASTPESRLTGVASDLGVVWGMAFISDTHMVFTERGGKAGILDTGSGSVQWLSGLPKVRAYGQGGLMDVAISPREGNWLYFTYSKPAQDGAATTLARARLQGQALLDWQDLLVTDSASREGRHFGSRIVFDGEGHLFFSVGDRSHRPNGQDLSTHAGKILRVNLDGTAPDDNPFVGRADAKPEIWSYGHRNPQGLCLDQARDGLWAGEHGPRGGDEINWIEPGLNYGWARVSHGKEYWGPVDVGEATSLPGMVDPRYLYIPSIAPGSLLCYDAGLPNANPAWQNRLLQGSLKLTHLNLVTIDDNGQLGNEQRLFEDRGERIRSLRQSPTGELYLGTDGGRIYRVVFEQ